jgi:adenylyl cyclase-associated protein
MIDKTFVHTFFACQNTVVRIQGKIKSVSLEGCKKITLFVHDVVSEVNIMNCQGIKIFALGKLNQVTIESTSEVTINLKHANKGCKVATTCTRSIWLRWPKPEADDNDDDNENWFRQPIAETYETILFEGKELQTKPMESLE